jgi:thioesterase domain-containing protein
VTLFRASVQPDPRLPLDLGWTPFAEGGVEVFELPGDHDLVFREPNIQVLAAQLRACLERSEAERSDLERSGVAEVRLREPAAVLK